MGEEQLTDTTPLRHAYMYEESFIVRPQVGVCSIDMRALQVLQGHAKVADSSGLLEAVSQVGMSNY